MRRPAITEPFRAIDDSFVGVDDEECPTVVCCCPDGNSAVAESITPMFDFGVMATSEATVVVVDDGGPTICELEGFR